jgi:hypothetical protein
MSDFSTLEEGNALRRPCPESFMGFVFGGATSEERFDCVSFKLH